MEYDFRDFLIMPPAYYKGNTDAGIFLFYKKIITATPKVKIILYNFEKKKLYKMKNVLLVGSSSDIAKSLINENQFDFILIDRQAGIDEWFQTAIHSAKEAIIVVTPEVPSIRDADRVIGSVSYTHLRAHETQ